MGKRKKNNLSIGKISPLRNLDERKNKKQKLPKDIEAKHMYFAKEKFVCFKYGWLEWSEKTLIGQIQKLDVSSKLKLQYARVATNYGIFDVEYAKITHMYAAPGTVLQISKIDEASMNYLKSTMQTIAEDAHFKGLHKIDIKELDNPDEGIAKRVTISNRTKNLSIDLYCNGVIVCDCNFKKRVFNTHLIDGELRIKPIITRINVILREAKKELKEEKIYLEKTKKEEREKKRIKALMEKDKRREAREAKKKAQK